MAATPLRVGSVTGRITVLHFMTGAEIGQPNAGRFAYVRCECGTRRYLPARRIGIDYFSCGQCRPDGSRKKLYA